MGLEVIYYPDGTTKTVEHQDIPKTPVVLSHLAFITLLQLAGGMTDDMLIKAKQDANLAALWIKFEMADDINGKNALTQQGLAALEALGYLPNGVKAVNSGWPTT